MRKWRLIWRVIYDVIRGEAEKNISLFSSTLILTGNLFYTLWPVLLTRITLQLEMSRYGNRIFDVVDFISLESFIEYLWTFEI